MTRFSLVFIFALCYVAMGAQNLLDEIKSHPNLALVSALLEKDRLLSTHLLTHPLTAFLPSDEALSKFEGIQDSTLLKYHLANTPYLVQDLPEELLSLFPGNPRLYVTSMPSGKLPITGWEQHNYYINDALVTEANLPATTSDGRIQYLHIIDRVIEPPVTPVSQVDDASPATDLIPDAQKLLENSSIYGLVDEFDISDFQKRVKFMNVERVFNMSGKNTFFLPVNSDAKLFKVMDKSVIEGHVVPTEALFLRPLSKSNTRYEPLALADNLKTRIAMQEMTFPTGEGSTYHVTSSTEGSAIPYGIRIAMARIVKGNIPVMNGVVHLIDRPLMVLARSILFYLEEMDDQLTKFYRLMSDHLPDFLPKLNFDGEMTLFAPSDEAFNLVDEDRLHQVMMDKEHLERLLKLHVIDRLLTSDEIIDHSTHEVETLSDRRKLYFAVSPTIGGGSSSVSMPTVTVDGAGVNATIMRADIGARNGVIHIIDRILGIPSQTVYDKLASDPTLSSSFFLSEQNEWNNRLKSRDERFTLFVPSNDAWNYIQRTIPSTHKQLFTGEFAHQVRSILERHLIVGEAYSVEELSALPTNSTPRPQMMRGNIGFQARVQHSFGEYYVEWQDLRAKVVRPDVDCVNGIIHVIDSVLMLDTDGHVSSTPTFSSFLVLTASLALLVVLIVLKGILGH